MKQKKNKDGIKEELRNKKEIIEKYKEKHTKKNRTKRRKMEK